MPSHSSPLLLLAPQLYGSWGGVQTYMRRLREILCSYADAHSSQCLALSLIDNTEQLDLHTNPVRRERFRGCGGSKLNFLFRCLAASLTHRGGFAIVGHLGLGPTAFFLRQAGLIRGYALVLHGLEAWERAPWLKRLAAAHADSIIATTRYTAHEFAHANDIPECRMRVIPLALAEQDAVLAPRSNHDADDFRLLAVSRLSIPDQYKGIDTVIEAVRMLRRDEIPVRLRIVGSGDDQPRLRRIAAELTVLDHVEFLGSVSQSELERQYEECDLFTLPSAKEGFGIVFLEAMRHSKPCLGARHGGIPEVIDHGVDGYLVDYGDAAQVAACVRELWSDPERKQAMSRAARAKVADRYCFQHMQSEWFRYLDETLEETTLAPVVDGVLIEK